MTDRTAPVVVTFSDDTDTAAVSLAAAEAGLHGRRLTVVHAGDERTVRRAVTALTDLDARYLHVDEPLDEALIRLSRDAFLVVTTAAGDRRPAARRVAAHAANPTLVASARHVEPSAPVMLAVDARHGAPRAGAFAFAEASARQVELAVLYVAAEVPDGPFDTVDPFAYDAAAAMEAGDRLLAEALAGYSDRYPDVAVVRRTWHDPTVVRAIADRAEKAGLLVVATRDHPRMSERLLGSVTGELLGATPCPLAVVPAR
ncbi:universal stress protein [Asanoa sp. NPDC049518]|uniref:universal stress protein n=1 Tax=unclassified Asanoa TaxID=2685164 RepID=UPI00342F14CF